MHTEPEKLKPIGNGVFLRMPSATQETITTKSGVTLYIPSFLDHERYATVQAEVYGVGNLCKLPVQEGDIVAVDYRVSSSYTERGDGSVDYKFAFYNGSELLWKCEPQYLMAVLRGDEWEAVGDWVIMDVVYENTAPVTSLVVPDQMFTRPRPGAGKLVSGDIPAPVGSILLFNDDYRSEYRFPDGSEKIILNKALIHAYT